MSFGTSLRVRRVGFRGGTDEELTALHGVEVPVAAECGSNRMPVPVESYKAFARNLPSQFDDHAWLVETSERISIAAGFCWSNAAGDERVMECEVSCCQKAGARASRHDYLQQSATRRPLRDGLCSRGPPTTRCRPVKPSLAGSVPASRGWNRTSELVLSGVDWAMVERWALAEPARDLGYRLEMIDGAFPEHLRDDAATLHHIMQTAPRDELDASDVSIDAEFVAELDRVLIESGRERWAVLVRDPDGVCVGGTEVTFESWNPGTVYQQNTGIDRDHRRLGLAKWVKATMLKRICQDLPRTERVRTDNAFSNTPMLAINDSLGFNTINARTEWQADVSDLRRVLH